MKSRFSRANLLLQSIIIIALSLTLTTRGQTKKASVFPSRGVTKPAQLVVQRGHYLFVQAIALSTDGKYLVTGGDDTAKLWEVETGRELRTFPGHRDYVTAVAISTDGKYLATGGGELPRLWEVETGKQVRAFIGHSDSIESVVFSKDGKFLISGSDDNTIKLWEVATGRELRTFKGHSGAVVSAALSANGKYLVTGSEDKTAKLWDIETGKELRIFSRYSSSVESVALSADGKYLVTAGGIPRLWEVETGRELRTFGQSSGYAALSADGKRLVTTQNFNIAKLWDVGTGRELATFTIESHSVARVALSSDGKYVALGGDQSAKMWEAETGREVNTFKTHSNSVVQATLSADNKQLVISDLGMVVKQWDIGTGHAVRTFRPRIFTGISHVALSADGKYLATLDFFSSAVLWEAATGKELRKFGGEERLPHETKSLAFSPDGKYLVTSDNGASLWDVETGKEVQVFDGHSGTILAVALSMDNKFLVTGGEDETAKLWEVATGRELRTFSGHLQAIEEVMLSGDGRYLVTGSADGTVKVWDIPTGKERRSFSGRGGYQHAVAFSADGKYLVTCVGYAAKLWEVETGRELQVFGGEDYPVTSVALSADSKYLVTGNSDSTTCIWRLQDGKLLCRIISFNENNWAVVDPDGRYDASNGSEVEGLYWVVGNESISLDQLKDRFYEPGLLAKVLGINKEPLRDISAFKEVSLFPAIDYNVPRAGSTNVNIRLTSRGGGIGKVRVLVNSKEVITDSRIVKLIHEGDTKNLTVDMANAPVIAGKPNLIEVIAWNAEGYLSSRPVRREWVPTGDTPIKTPELYAIVTGISNYAAPELSLRYAAKDAEDIARALAVGAKRLFGAEKVHLRLLTTSNNPQASAPTKSNIRRAFVEARKAKPWDVLVVYFAGHAGTTSIPHELYCYLTSESSSANLEDPLVRERSAITSEELAEWIKQIPALKQVMILDTCQAGALAMKLTEKRDIPSDQVRAIERLKDRTGFHILMGAAADAVSYEATRYGQGLLTYALLQGMKGAALRDDEYADVSRLFQYAADQVPQLARNIGGVQKPVIAAPRGTSFDMGLFLKEDKEAIPLAMVMPIILRPMLLNPEQGFDNLGLLPLIRKELQEDSYTNTGEGLHMAQMIFVDVEELPGAIRPSGIYTVEGERVKANLFLIQDGRPIAQFSIEGDKRNPPQLAHAIVEAFGEAIKRTRLVNK